MWELNRHQWVVRLAQAWALTGDERYAEACISAIDSWLEANPPGLGINWASSLEVSYRLIAWCWVLLLIRNFPEITGEWVMKVLAAIWRHAIHVSSYLSYYFSPNTHLTGEALGLFYAGVLFREFDAAPEWRGRGMHVLVSESRKQISADGVHFEQSTCYQRYTIDIYQHFALLAARSNIRVPVEVDRTLQHMVDFLLAVRWPNGSVPVIGDADGGWLMPLVRRSPDDGRGLFATAAAMFDRTDFAWAADGPAPELLWLLGPDGLANFNELRPDQPARAASRLFATGGYAVMRDGWHDEANQMIVDVGPLGCPISSGHGHADLLSLQCAVAGQPCVVDAGNYCYTSEAEWREFFRSTAVHNTVMIDGHSQCETTGPFRWRWRPQVLLREWRSNPDVDFLDAEHDAYCNLRGPRCAPAARALRQAALLDGDRRSRREIAPSHRSDFPVRANARHARPRQLDTCPVSVRRGPVDWIVRLDQSDACAPIRRSSADVADGLRRTTASASRRPRSSSARRTACRSESSR